MWGRGSGYRPCVSTTSALAASFSSSRLSPHYLLCLYMLVQKLAPCHLAPDHDVRRAQQRHRPPMVLRPTAGVVPPCRPESAGAKRTVKSYRPQLIKDCSRCSRLMGPSISAAPKEGSCGGMNPYRSAVVCHGWESRSYGHSTGLKAGARVDGATG